MPSAISGWLDLRTAGAPDRLRACVHEFVAGAGGPELVAALANAGNAALEAAIAAGSDRAAALDLLAADALITLALLAQSEQDPTALGQAARALRSGATR